MDDINHRLPYVASDEKQLRYATFADSALQERIEFLPGSNPPHGDVWYWIQTSRTNRLQGWERPRERVARRMMDVHGHAGGRQLRKAVCVKSVTWSDLKQTACDQVPYSLRDLTPIRSLPSSLRVDAQTFNSSFAKRHRIHRGTTIRRVFEEPRAWRRDTPVDRSPC